ncbi:hypothetical protein SAMN05421837_107308 [Amycolatopsis pretoriensis]|uniref:Uncharacterized protein n=1 Tax=Amycolatopsis pretoriensis TaxID=218821 RepID=A0A1H5R894_9PSEU|nr:hypothetical protein [Amycolatopsis pretoriensis]SEF34294.1 hypothetical protein SAMN05421837_107308 [Amycolatopsis pretoriensis]
MFDVSNPEPPPGLNDIRSIRGGRPVWVDLARAYPLGEPLGIYPHGIDLQAVVPGDLRMWRRATTGQWVGWCNFKIGGADGAGGSRTSHFVVPNALEPRREGATWIDRRNAP